MGVKAHARRILSPRLSNTIRNSIVSVRASLGLLLRVDRPNCVSALMRARDEEWWIEPSILSVKDLVDACVIMDASTNLPMIFLEDLSRRYANSFVYRF